MERLPNDDGIYPNDPMDEVESRNWKLENMIATPIVIVPGARMAALCIRIEYPQFSSHPQNGRPHLNEISPFDSPFVV